jgi:GT2 family glycosyltransferase
VERRTPDIAVVVASHDRPLRLRWLLNALEDQTLSRERFEVLVGHDSRGEETEALLAEHPLGRTGTLRHERLPAGTAPPGANRNAAWRLARAPIIAFTDDDCRPPPDWLEKALAAARRHPDAVVQGKTVPDPEEEALLRAPTRHTQWIQPPSASAQACNIVYPRELLERLDGFDEQLYTGEDTELAARARKLGAAYVGAPEALTYHAVIPMSLLRELRSLPRWKDMPAVVKRHPELRDDFELWIFWHPRHVWLPLALAGAVLGRRNPLYALLAFPYAMHAFPSHGLKSPRGRLRSLIEFPNLCIRDAVEIAVLAWGSAKARTLFL